MAEPTKSTDPPVWVKDRRLRPWLICCNKDSVRLIDKEASQNLTVRNYYRSLNLEELQRSVDGTGGHYNGNTVSRFA
jgi:hypothetical protein